MRRCHCIQAKKPRRGSAACNGLAVADLAWAACCDWNDAIISMPSFRSSSCFDFYMIEAKPENLIGDRAYDSIAAPSGLRDGSPRAC